MALTKVGPAGIGSTPGTGYVIGDSFLHSTGLNATNAYYTGIVTAQTFRVLGNFQVDGTTTTLDTEVTSVDKLEVAANNTTVGVAITQSGSGDILNLYDGSTEVFTVKDGGNIGIGIDNPTSKLQVANGHINLSAGYSIQWSDSHERIEQSDGKLKFFTANGEKMVLSGDNVGINSTAPTKKLDVQGHAVFGPSATRLHTYSDSGYSGIYNGSSLTSDESFYMGGGNLYFRADGGEVIRVLANGNVGISTGNPNDHNNFSRALDINGPSGAAVYMRTSGSSTNTFIVGNYGSEAYINNVANGNIRFFTSGTEKFRISNTGLVGIGTAVPGAALHVLNSSYPTATIQRDHAVNYPRLRLTNTSNHGADLDGIGDGSPAGGFRVSTVNSGNSTERLRITSAGDVKIGTTNNVTFGSRRALTVANGTTGAVLSLYNSTTATSNPRISSNPGGSEINDIGIHAASTNGNIIAYTNNDTERLRITSAGLVGIGTVAPFNNSSDIDIRGGSSALSDGGQIVTIGVNTKADNTSQLAFGVSDADGYGWIRSYASGVGGKDLVFASVAENLRITSAGNVTIGGKSNPNWSSTVDALTIGYAGVLYEDSYTSGTDNYIILGNNTFYNASSGGNTYIRNDQAQRIMMQGGAWWFQSAGTGTAGNAITYTDRLRITNDGKVGINMSTPTFELDVNGRFRATHGSSGLFFEEINNGAALWLDGANGDFSGGDYYGIIADNSGRLQFGYAGAAHMQLNNTGQLYLNGYPHDHTVAGGSHLKLRAGAGAWGISLGMRASQNDYAYFGFTDMNGDEQIGDIFMQRTGTSTGHMVFSTNNGSAGSSNRLKIDSNGRTCISPTSHFGSASTNMALSIVNNGGTGGYPAIHLGSVATGGNTNSVQGMSLVATDANWNLQTSSGGVHGLGILTGNSSNSGNAAMYIRSDKKTITGPSCYDELDTAISSGTAFCVAGGGLSIGSLGNGGDTVQGGRNVIGWYMYRYNGTGGYAHLTTSLWGGASSNSMYMMGGFRIHGYRYSSAGVSEENIYFHNWSGSLANYSRYHWGNWDPGNTVYVNSGGYVTLRLSNGSYYGYDIDLIQHAWYPIRDIKVTNVTYNGNATI